MKVVTELHKGRKMAALVRSLNKNFYALLLLGQWSALNFARPATWLVFHSINTWWALMWEEESYQPAHKKVTTRTPAARTPTLSGKTIAISLAWSLYLIDKSTQNNEKITLRNPELKEMKMDDPKRFCS